MKILQTLARVYTSNIDGAVQFYENLTGTTAGSRFTMASIGLELAVVGDVLIIAGSDEAVLPFRSTNATFLVDSVGEYLQFLNANGGTVLHPPQQVPTGINMTVRHPDGLVVEYVEHRH